MVTVGMNGTMGQEKEVILGKVDFHALEFSLSRGLLVYGYHQASG